MTMVPVSLTAEEENLLREASTTEQWFGWQRDAAKAVKEDPSLRNLSDLGYSICAIGPILLYRKKRTPQ